ncbi:MAG: hypothetical protein OXC48_03865 [Endozoicomonadaceae bacterium]|nr:hypothetical protein [Endozoicomonadaceae bacterium]
MFSRADIGAKQQGKPENNGFSTFATDKKTMNRRFEKINFLMLYTHDYNKPAGIQKYFVYSLLLHG